MEEVGGETGINNFPCRNLIFLLTVPLHWKREFLRLADDSAVDPIFAVAPKHVTISAAGGDFRAAVPWVPDGHRTSPPFTVAILRLVNLSADAPIPQ